VGKRETPGEPRRFISAMRRAGSGRAIFARQLPVDAISSSGSRMSVDSLEAVGYGFQRFVPYSYDSARPIAESSALPLKIEMRRFEEPSGFAKIEDDRELLPVNANLCRLIFSEQK